MIRKLFNPAEAEATLKRSRLELELKTVSHTEAWGLGSTERWDADLDEGIITFSSPGLIVTASVQVIGAFNSANDTWLWGWDHPSVIQPLAQDAHLARRFGERYGLQEYASAHLHCPQDKAWEFTAVACHLAQASGAYRGPSGETFVFMTFHDVTIRKEG
jgi:hypothetical protein